MYKDCQCIVNNNAIIWGNPSVFTGVSNGILQGTVFSSATQYVDLWILS